MAGDETDSRSAVKKMWQNGGRPLLIAFAIFAVGAVALIGSLVALLLPGDQFAPLGEYENPARILNRVPGVTDEAGNPMPALRVGETLQLQRRRCVNEDTPVVLTRHLESQDTPAKPRVDLPVLNQSRFKGCDDQPIGVELPPQTPSGRWTLVVEETAYSIDEGQGVFQTKLLQSETFLLVP